MLFSGATALSRANRGRRVRHKEKGRKRRAKGRVPHQEGELHAGAKWCVCVCVEKGGRLG